MNQRGNVLIYILIAVALFAALGFTLSRTMRSSSGDATQMSDDQADLYAQEMINYASQTGSVIQQMTSMGGTDPSSLDFVKPGETGFETAPNINKVFHPAGGGLNVFNQNRPVLFNPAEPSLRRGWSINKGSNFLWSPSSAPEVIVSFIDLNPAICAKINQRLLGSNVIPATTLDYSSTLAGGTTQIDTARCAACAQKPRLCVSNANDRYAFYTVVISR